MHDVIAFLKKTRDLSQINSVFIQTAPSDKEWSEGEAKSSITLEGSLLNFHQTQHLIMEARHFPSYSVVKNNNYTSLPIHPHHNNTTVHLMKCQHMPCLNCISKYNTAGADTRYKIRTLFPLTRQYTHVSWQDRDV